MAKCSYRTDYGRRCEEERMEGSEFCFWHDPGVAKGAPKVAEKVKRMVREGFVFDGCVLKGIDLSHADLSGARMVKADLSGANLERANLEKGRLFGANLKGANLFNANLRGANLKETDLRGANVLAAKFEGAKLLGANFGKNYKVVNEREAESLEGKEAIIKYREAEDIYRHLRLVTGAQGLFLDSGEFFYREMVVRRMQLPLFSKQRLFSKAMDVVCGYGERSSRIILSAAGYMLVNALIFYNMGIRYGGDVIKFIPGAPLVENVQNFLMCVYFSVVTLTTLGYGDIHPLAFSRVFAAFEAFVGAFMMALFVLVFGRKMMR